MWREHGGPLAWTQAEHFAAAHLHALQIANWQRTKDGQRGVNAPHPVEPPRSREDRERSAFRINARAQAFLDRQKARQRPAD